jgi:mannose-6-phosphate isomerase-like protein (cupin superfamily)
MIVDAPPVGGPRLHKHPYEGVFVVQEGNATFTAGEETIEVTPCAAESLRSALV